jgi:hypothetical protein
LLRGDRIAMQDLMHKEMKGGCDFRGLQGPTEAPNDPDLLTGEFTIADLLRIIKIGKRPRGAIRLEPTPTKLQRLMASFARWLLIP